MKVSIISFTAKGDELNKKIEQLIRNEQVEANGKTFNPKGCYLGEWTGKAFAASDAVIFIGAVGIAVRAIAPYVGKKDTDPAVICIDEAARFVIPLLSGHIGGANAFAEELADKLGSCAVITTATDINGVFAVDTWAVNSGYAIDNIDEIKHISGALLGGETVGLVSDFKISGRIPEGIEQGTDHECGICISDEVKKPFLHTLNLIPKRYVIGAGSRRDADENALIELFSGLGINEKAVDSVATIDIKKNEKSIRALAEKLDTGLKLYTTEELNRVPGEFEVSEFVKKTTGTDNVCERAAAASGGMIVIHKTKGDGVTIAAAVKDWSVSF
ncbi:MAG: cobalamin biosynthesis protein [Oscillospiraceae bacterium]|nr:cobalamin biosynthesis protein [Oscillospiraceae bacterium]